MIQRLAIFSRATARRESVPADHSTASLAALLLCGLGALVFATAWEWPYYSRLNQWDGLGLSCWSPGVVMALLWSKTMFVLAPLWMAFVWLRRRWPKVAAGMLLFGTALVFAYLQADLHVQQTFGGNASDYLPFVYDALAATSEIDHTEWSGGWSGIARMIGMLFAATLASVVAAWWVLGFVGRRVLRSRSDRLRNRLSAVATVLVLLAALLAVPLQCSVRPLIAVWQLHDSLPIALPYFDARDSALARWFGMVVDPPRPVQITAVLPNPMGADNGREEVHVRNFTDTEINLLGWTLTDHDGNSMPLWGVLPADGMRKLVLPPDGLRLNNDGDELRVLDPRGETVHQVSYTRDDAGLNRLIQFQCGLDEFILQVQSKVTPTFRRLVTAPPAPPPADPSARVVASSPPNVIYIVLESFQHKAVSDALLSRLEALGRRGLRLRRHYAGTNCSHLGWFALLYGRSPAVYSQTLDGGVEPQTIRSLRTANYECTFITSGDCTQWRQMGDFLNQTNFDRLELVRGASWHDWPQRDQRLLARVGELANTRDGRPRFIASFLMTSHYPYPFPAEFAVHRPCGDDKDFRGDDSWLPTADWSAVNETILRNRYKNALLFLEDEILKLVDSLDPARNIIVITGDHGESLGEDGGLTHGTLPSEIQTRVPMLIIGPGVPVREISQPTTHADVLPTLLHILNGKQTTIASSYGRDVLVDPLDDRVALVSFRWCEPYELLLVQGEERVQFRYRLSRPGVEVAGFVDESAHVDPGSDHNRSLDAAGQWSEHFLREWQRILR